MWRAERSRKLSKSGGLIDFKFSNFQAIQVPKGWDKLLVSIISVETGKTIAKSNKALVKNGNCQWTESLSESLWISHDDGSKELEEHLLKLVVSMGSARSGILGEAIVNMAQFLSSRASDPLSLPLRKCNFGTVLLVQIQCFTPRTKLRVEDSRSSNSNAENQDQDDERTKSNASVVSVTRSIKSAISSSSQDLRSPSQPEKLESSYSTSNSAEESSRKERLYSKDNRAMVRYNLNEQQDSASSSSPNHVYPLGEISTSNHSSFKSRITHSGDDLQNNEEEEYGQSQSFTYAASSRNLLEAAEDTIEELRDEAKMWERNARKLILNLDILKEKFSRQSKKLADTEIELSAAEKENDGMKKEVDFMKFLLEELVVKQKTAAAGTTFQAEGASHIQRELEKEIKFLEESNAGLTLLLEKSQESNVELLSILQEMEETIEKQKEEMEDLSVVRRKVRELERSIEEYLEEKRKLLLELDHLQESEKTLQSNMQILEQSLSDKVNDLEKERSSNRKYLSDLEREYRDSLSFKEEEIVSLEEKLSEYLREREEDRLDHMREMEAQERKIRELERDCSELTDENLELLQKYKDSKKVMEENQLKEIEYRAEMAERRAHIERLEACLLSKKDETEFLRQSCMDLEAQVSDLTSEKDQLQEDMQIALRESNITSKCLDDLRNDLTVLSSSVDSHISVNKILERKSLELEKGKHEAEVRLFEVEEENLKFSEQISELEAQLKYVTDEQESTRSDLEASRSLTLGLREEIRRLTDEMERQEKDLKETLHDKETRLSNVQEEYEYVKTENQKLQISAESLIDECDTLQKSYEEMRRLKAELQWHCSYLETELTETRKSLTFSSKSVEALEEKVKFMVEDFSSKEKCLTSELDELRQENWKLNEKIIMEESLLNQMYVEKTAEIEELGTEMEQLRREVSGLYEERERTAAEAAKQASSLLADKAKLELAVQEFKTRVELIEDELHSVRVQSESKIQTLTIELSASKESYEKLNSEKERLETAVKEFESRVELTENELQTVRSESESKIQALTIELMASKESYEKLIEEVASSKKSHEKRLRLLSGYRSREDKLKTAVNDLELKITVSEYERQQLIEEAANLKSQFRKTSQIQDEVLALKRKLDESKFETENLEASLHLISAKYEELRKEKISFVEKISSLQKSMAEFEECKDKRKTLEEKVVRLEGEKDEFLKKNEALEELLKAKHDQSNSGSKKGNETPYDEMDYVAKIEMLEAELDEALNANSKYRGQLQRLTSEGRNNTLVPKERYERTKSSLETELKEIRDRYFQMSLKYAEVEAEREDLVMQLKSNKSVKKSSKRSDELSDE